MQNILDAIVHISPSGEPSKSGLGILCGEIIFTCTHLHDSLPIRYSDTCFFNVTRACDNEKGVFAMLVGTTLDLMVLAPNGMHAALSEDGGPTSSSWDVVCLYAESHDPLTPAAISFPPNSNSAVVPGFFFAPDGKTLIRAQFHLEKYSELIKFDSNRKFQGCSGGPLFTEDLKLIGIATNQLNFPGENGFKECLAKRIDLCVPMLLHRTLNWDKLSL